MQKYNQLITDIVVICILPVVVVFGYRFFVIDAPDFSSDLLSAESGVATPGDTSTLGAKSKEILNQLNSITFDKSLFSDPAYLSLQDFTPPYYSTSTGREYPFDIPVEVRQMVKESITSATPTTTSSAPSPKKAPATTPKKVN